jgi:hypothetical protein
LDSYDKENEAQTRRIIEQSVLTVGGVDLSGVDTSIEDLEERVTVLETADSMPKWTLLAESVLAGTQATPWDLAIPSNDATELRVEALVVGGALTGAVLSLRGASTPLAGRGRQIRVEGATISAVAVTALELDHPYTLSSTVQGKLWLLARPEIVRGFTANTSGTQNTVQMDFFLSDALATAQTARLTYSGTGQFAVGSLLRVYGRNTS